MGQSKKHREEIILPSSLLPRAVEVCEALRKRLQLVGMQTMFKPFLNLWSFISNFEDGAPLNLHSGVAYNIPLRSSDLSYTGESKRKRETRLKERARNAEKATQATIRKSELLKRW